MPFKSLKSRDESYQNNTKSNFIKQLFIYFHVFLIKKQEIVAKFF